jgi:hypothetical protein
MTTTTTTTRPVTIALTGLVCLLSTAACLPGKLVAKSRLKVVNTTASTPFCGVSVGSEHIDLPVAPGAAGEVDVPRGIFKTCVIACKAAIPAVGATATDRVGCDSLNLTGPREIYVFEGKEPPHADVTPGFQQTVWLSNVDPRYAENRRHPWLNALGDVVPHMWHVHVTNPCDKTVFVGHQDVKGMGQRGLHVDPKEEQMMFGDKPPVYLYFSTTRPRLDEKPAFDLPAGSYEMEISSDCRSIELKEEKYADGATKKAKRL